MPLQIRDLFFGIGNLFFGISDLLIPFRHLLLEPLNLMLLPLHLMLLPLHLPLQLFSAGQMRVRMPTRSCMLAACGCLTVLGEPHSGERASGGRLKNNPGLLA
jgi:hypothetical protein